METTTESSALTSMTATLCVYLDRWGPQSTYTLALMVEVAEAHRRTGDLALSRRLLETAVRDANRYISPTADVRMRALESLRDLSLQQRDYIRAAAAQKEIVECQASCRGSHHPDTLAASSLLATILLEPLEPTRVLEV